MRQTFKKQVFFPCQRAASPKLGESMSCQRLTPFTEDVLRDTPTLQGTPLPSCGGVALAKQPFRTQCNSSYTCTGNTNKQAVGTGAMSPQTKETMLIGLCLLCLLPATPGPFAPYYFHSSSSNLCFKAISCEFYFSDCLSSSNSYGHLSIE